MIPQELKERPQWLAWYYDQEGCKIPIGKSNDARTWQRFEDIRCGNIAFVISADDPYCGIDLDDCFIDGQFTELAGEVLEVFSGVAYAEFSPSGTGIKLTTRARKPAGSRCSEGKWLECYDHSRFWTMTGNCVDEQFFGEIGDGQVAVDWLVEKWLKQDEAKQSKPLVQPKIIVDSLFNRACGYVDSADVAGVGGRNNAAFRLAGHLAAMVGADNERLSESEIDVLVRQWNGRLPEPLSETEIASVVKSAMRNGTPREEKPPTVMEFEQYEILDIDWESLNSGRDEDFDDESFAQSLVPDGLLGMIFEHYSASAYRKSSVMGLAVAVSLMQVILGRKIRSHTDLRTNDYNLVLAATGSGKEACEATITKILEAADPQGKHLFPPDVQSGNGLMKQLSVMPCGIWVCDEFGKILQAVLDKKGNQHLKNIGNHLLKLYGKSAGSYGGAAHSDGIRNRVHQPHLCLLGLATPSSVFEAVAAEQISDGLIGRIAFWSVQERPAPKEDMEIVPVPEALIHEVKGWVDFEPPGGNLAPDPVTLRMSAEALARWKSHARAIDMRMRDESELRAAIWSRVAARSMKLALVHRCSRLGMLPAQAAWDFVHVETEDVDWAVRLSNWLANTACSLIRENVMDKSGAKAKAILAGLMAANPDGIKKRDVLRQYRSLTAGDLGSAAAALGLKEDLRGNGARKQIWYVAQSSLGQLADCPG